MNVSVRPPDFFRLFAIEPSVGGGAGGEPAVALRPPPLPENGSVYHQFGGAYSEPPVYVPPLASFGRQQLYDERCLQEPPAGWAQGSDAAWPSPKSELHRLSADVRGAIRRLLLSCSAPSEETRAVAAELELLLVNMQHLAARLREGEALGRLIQEHEYVVRHAQALIGNSPSGSNGAVGANPAAAPSGPSGPALPRR